MPLTLSGTSGITFPNGSAGTPALTGIDTDTGVFFGTDTVALTTAGSQRLIVDSGGKVGVNATPSGNLSISYLQVGKGQISSDHTLYNYNTAFTNNAYQSGNGIFSAISTNPVGVVHLINNNLYFLNSSASVTAGQNASVIERFRIDSTGYLGLSNFNGTAGLGRIELGESGRIFIEGYDTGNAGSGSYLRFGDPTTERFRISSTGNVGIGTDNPLEKLHVAGTIHINGGATGGGVNIKDGAYLHFGTLNSTGSTFIGYGVRAKTGAEGAGTNELVSTTSIGLGRSAIVVGSVSGGTSGNFQVWTGPGESGVADGGTLTNFQQRLTVDSVGNVGIGTINPSAKLSVWNGTAAVYNSSTGNAVWNAGTTNGNGLMKVFRSDATVFLRVDSDAKKVGIQTDSPTDTLTVYNSNIGNPTGITIRNTEATSDYSHARLRLESKNGTAYGEIWADVANSSLRTGYNSSATTYLTEQGNLGIGAIPASDINGTYRALKIYNNAYVTGYTSNTYPALHLNVNARPTTSSFSAGFVRDVAGTYTNPMSLEMYAGQLTLRGASTGAADSAITWENRFRIESNGNVSIGNGNLVFSTAGTGIDFSAASGSAAGSTSSLLDDYEEGTFTVTMQYYSGGWQNATFSNTPYTTGYYVKVGNLCTAYYYSSAFQLNIASGYSALFLGLPFAAANLTNGYGTGSVTHVTCFQQTNQNIYVAPNASYVVPLQSNSTTTSTWNNTANVYIMWSVTYRTN